MLGEICDADDVIEMAVIEMVNLQYMLLLEIVSDLKKKNK